MSSRYYESCSSGSEIRPGRISAELREALNIPENDLPIWIYRMRALGYPPGWLKKAVVDVRDIFDTDATDNDSAGSRKRKSPDDEVQYDHSKLIEYPGFNAPMPKNCVDYHYYVNMPAMLEHQQLEYAKKHMNSFKPMQIPKNFKRIKKSLSAEDFNSSLDQSSANESLVEGIKLISKGSPMPKQVERAPLEKFSVGVGELLYFENVASSSSGSNFESIRTLLKSVSGRQTKDSPDEPSPDVPPTIQID